MPTTLKTSRRSTSRHLARDFRDDLRELTTWSKAVDRHEHERQAHERRMERRAKWAALECEREGGPACS